jgi:uncharacterized protein YbjQ (UPF0145 family)
MLATLLLIGCKTTEMAVNKTGWSDYASIVTKDFTTVGLIRVQSTEITKRGFLGFTHEHKGSTITYDALIAEARNLGADDIINVRIDRTDKSVHTIFDWLVGYTETVEYVGNALAIKYGATEPRMTPGKGTGATTNGMKSTGPSLIESLQALP